jgi:hypothetical protein
MRGQDVKRILEGVAAGKRAGHLVDGASLAMRGRSNDFVAASADLL